MSVEDIPDRYVALINQIVDSAKHAAELSILCACASGGVSIGIEILIEHDNAAAFVASPWHCNVHVNMLIFGIIVYVEETCRLLLLRCFLFILLSSFLFLFSIPFSLCRLISS